MKVTDSYGMVGKDWSIDNSQLRVSTRVKCRVRMTRLWGLNPCYSPTKAMEVLMKEAEYLTGRKIEI